MIGARVSRDEQLRADVVPDGLRRERGWEGGVADMHGMFWSWILFEIQNESNRLGNVHLCVKKGTRYLISERSGDETRRQRRRPAEARKLRGRRVAVCALGYDSDGMQTM